MCSRKGGVSVLFAQQGRSWQQREELLAWHAQLAAWWGRMHLEGEGRWLSVLHKQSGMGWEGGPTVHQRPLSQPLTPWSVVRVACGPQPPRSWTALVYHILYMYFFNFRVISSNRSHIVKLPVNRVSLRFLCVSVPLWEVSKSVQLCIILFPFKPMGLLLETLGRANLGQCWMVHGICVCLV